MRDQEQQEQPAEIEANSIVLRKMRIPPNSMPVCANATYSLLQAFMLFYLSKISFDGDEKTYDRSLTIAYGVGLNTVAVLALLNQLIFREEAQLPVYKITGPQQEYDIKNNPVIFGVNSYKRLLTDMSILSAGVVSIAYPDPQVLSSVIAAACLAKATLYSFNNSYDMLNKLDKLDLILIRVGSLMAVPAMVIEAFNQTEDFTVNDTARCVVHALAGAPLAMSTLYHFTYSLFTIAKGIKKDCLKEKCLFGRFFNRSPNDRQPLLDESAPAGNYGTGQHTSPEV
jgi:hypothetical protein